MLKKKKKRKKKRVNPLTQQSKTKRKNELKKEEEKAIGKTKSESTERNWESERWEKPILLPWCRHHARETHLTIHVAITLDPSHKPVPILVTVTCHTPKRPLTNAASLMRDPSSHRLLHCSCLYSSQVFNLSFKT